MADAPLNFKIGSTFSGAGFQAANKEIQNAAKEGKKLSGAFGNVLAEAQKLDGAMGKVAGGVGSVINGFAQLGIVGGIVAGVKAGMDAVFDSLKEGYDKMVKEAQRGAEEQKRALQRVVDSHIKEVATANEATKRLGAEAVKQFDEVAAAAVRASQLIAQTDIARGTNSIANMQVEKLNAIIKEETDAGKALVAAKYDVQIAEKKAAQQAEQSATAIANAQQQVVSAHERVAQTNNQVALAEAALAEARDKQTRLAHIRMADTKALAQEVRTAETNLAAARREQAKSAEGVFTAEEKLKQVELTQATARANAEAGILQAKMALDKVNAAEEAAAAARQKEAEEAEKAAKRLALQQQAADREQFIKDDARDAIAGLQNEIKQLTDEIKEINDSRDRAQRGVNTERGVNNWGPGYNWQLDQNGVPNNFIDWKRAERFFERAERDRKTAEKRDNQFQEKMRLLQEKADKRGTDALSKREREQLKQWQAYQEAKHGRERREQEIKEKQAVIDRIRRQMADDLRLIKEELKRSLELV